MSGQVDVFVVNRNMLPWLKLLSSQFYRLKPSIQARLLVWDNASTDGSGIWLGLSGIKHYLHNKPGSHADGLIGLMGESEAPYVAWLDVDALPIKAGWLDEAIETLKDESIGVTGLQSRLPGLYHKDFVHPSFCVFRRDLYERLKLDPKIVHDPLRTSFDVGEAMCVKVEEAGYRLHFLGKAASPPNQLALLSNKVVHAWTSWHMLVDDWFPPHGIAQIREGHRRILSSLGLLEEFLRYVNESVSRNPLCSRYFEKAVKEKGHLMHGTVIDYLKRNVTDSEVRGKIVLEVGSYDVNGTPRDVFAPLAPNEYHGVDVGAGPCVDYVLNVADLATKFGVDRFDIVISTEMLEHAADWKLAVNQMKAVLKPGGLLFITTRSPGFPYHGFPDDHWRFTISDFQHIFSDMEIIDVSSDIQEMPGVFLKARKPMAYKITDLSKVEVYRMEKP